MASEPEIFWRGEGDAQIIARIPVPPGAGKLSAPRRGANGPSGQARHSLPAAGQLHDIKIAGHATQLLPLVHPRQAAGLGGHTPEWARLHGDWQRTAGDYFSKHIGGVPSHTIRLGRGASG